MLPRTRYAPLLALALLLTMLAPARLVAEAPFTPPKPAAEVQTLLDAGRKAEQAQKLDEAERLYQQALVMARVLHDPSGEGTALKGLGVVSSDRPQPQKALEYYQQALTIYRAIGDRGGEAKTLYNIGNVYDDTGERQKALEYYQQALPLYRGVGDRDGEASVLGVIGAVYRVTGEPQKGLEYLVQSLTISRDLGDRLGEAHTLTRIGNVYGNIREPQRALEYHQQALTIYRAIGDRGGEAAALNNIGVVYRQTGELKKALDYFLQALPLHRAVGNKRFEASLLGNIGSVYRQTGEPGKAIESLLQAVPIHHAIGDRRAEAATLIDIGQLYGQTGEPQKALESFQHALPLFRVVGDRRGEAGTLGNIGIVYSDTGEPQKALESFQQALLIQRAVGDRRGEAAWLNSIGLVYADTGESLKALEYLQQALTLFRATGDRAGEGGTLNNIGEVYANTGEPQTAIVYYRQALPLFRAIGDRRSEGGTLTNIGLVYERTGESQKALEYYQQALLDHRAVGNKRFEANTLGALADVYERTGEPQKALEYYTLALTFRRAIGDRRGEAGALTSIAHEEQGQGRLAEAEAHLAQAVSLFETLRENLGGFSESKTRFLAFHLGAYYAYLDLLLQRHKPAQAFAVAQKTKARALLDLLQDGRVDLSSGLTPQERQQEEALRRKAEDLNRQMVREGVENEVGARQRYAGLQEELRTAERQWQLCTETLYARHPDLAQKRSARTATLEEIARLLPKDSALLEYIAVPRSQVTLFVVTAAGGKAQIRAYPLAVKSAELATEAAEFRAACGDPRREYAEAAQKLYGLLIAPAEKELAGKKRLVICPDGPLWDVPFAALQIAGHGGTGENAKTRRSEDAKGQTGNLFLAERYEIVYAYSATGAQAVLAERAARARARPQRTLLAFANPDFGTSKRFGDLDDLPGQRPIDRPSRPIDRPSRPIDVASRPIARPSRAYSLLDRGGRILPLTGTQQEAEALRRLIPGAAIYTGAAAQEATVKAQASGCRYLHFATHGFFNDADPLLSSIILAQPPPGSKEDGFLTAREIFDLKLNAEMVVLSSCNSARGETRTGEGIVGMTWALFVAGAPTQVVSQWSVDDASTARLMERFYAGVTQGKAKGAALREASMWLMRSRVRDYAHPYYWAPFVLMGDWR